MWVKLDDGVIFHPKVSRAGTDGFTWWVGALSYSARFSTNGYIPSSVVHIVGGALVAPTDVPAIIERLESIGMIERDEDGYQIHDYADYQPITKQPTKKGTCARPSAGDGTGRDGLLHEQQNVVEYASARARAEDRISRLTPEWDPFGFSWFWGAYPLKCKKLETIEAWDQVKPTDVEQAEILKHLAARRRDPDWLKDGGRFIPRPDRFILKRRWTDEIRVGPLVSDKSQRSVLAAAGAAARIRKQT